MRKHKFSLETRHVMFFVVGAGPMLEKPAESNRSQSAKAADITG